MFGGWVRKYKHQSAELGCEVVFSVFFPPAAAAPGAKVPVRASAHRAPHASALLLPWQGSWCDPAKPPAWAPPCRWCGTLAA